MESALERAYSVSEIVQAGYAGQSKIYLDLATGKLKANKIGDLTKILHSELMRWATAEVRKPGTWRGSKSAAA
jgi:hypothetical protein